MPSIREQEKKILELINISLPHYIEIKKSNKDNGGTIKMGFSHDDFKQCDCNQSVFFMILDSLKNKGYIKDIKINDLDDPYKMENGEITDVIGIFEADIIPEKFNKKFKKQEEELLFKDKKEDKPLIPVPKGTSWEDMSIKFINKFDVDIWIKNKHFKDTNNVKMGFYKGTSKDEKENKGWDLLFKIAINKGKLNDVIYLWGDDKKYNKDNIRNDASFLRKLLIRCFGIQNDPFCDCENHSYKTRFELLPETGLREENEFIVKTARYNENSNAYHANYNEDYDNNN